MDYEVKSGCDEARNCGGEKPTDEYSYQGGATDGINTFDNTHT